MNPFKLKNLKEQIANINKLMTEQRSGNPERSTGKQNAGAYDGVPFEDLEKINKDREGKVLAGDIYGELPPERDITPTSQDTWMTFTDPVTGRPTKTDTHVPSPSDTIDPWVTTFVTDDPRPDDIRVDEPTPEEPGVDFPITPVVECERTLPATGIHCQKCIFHLSQGFVPPVVANITGPNCECCESTGGGDDPVTGDTGFTGVTNTGDTTFTGETFIRCTQIEGYANSLGIQSGVPGVDGTTMTAADQFCIKCQSGGYAGDPMCDCCQTDYTYTDDNEIVYDPADGGTPLSLPLSECEEMAESYGGTLESHCIKCQSYTEEIESGSLSMDQLPDFYQEFCFNTNCCDSIGSDDEDDGIGEYDGPFYPSEPVVEEDPCTEIVPFNALGVYGLVPVTGPTFPQDIESSGIDLNLLIQYMQGDSEALDGYNQIFGDGWCCTGMSSLIPGLPTENLGQFLNVIYPFLSGSLNSEGVVNGNALDIPFFINDMFPNINEDLNFTTLEELQNMVTDCLNNGGPMNIPPIMGAGVGNITPTIGLGSVLDREDDITTGGEDDRGSVLGGTTDDDRKYGCTDPDALNYDPIANYDDGSCEYAIGEPIPGCTDPTAINYNPNATFDDGSCMTIVMMCEMFNNLGPVAQQIVCEGCQPGGQYENSIVCECCESVTTEDPVVRCEIEGDLNGDGEVNAQDATLYLQLATGEIPIEEIPCPTSYCDFSGVGDDMYNQEIVLQYVSNAIDELPPCGGTSSSGDDPRGSYEQPMGKDTCCKKCKNGKFSDTCCDKEVGEKRCIYRTITDCQLKRKKSRGKCKPRRTKK